MAIVVDENVLVPIKILFVDALDDVRLSDGKLIVVAFGVARPVGKPLASVLFLLELVLFGIVLDHGAHCTVVDCNAAGEQRYDVLMCAVTAADKVREGLG